MGSSGFGSDKEGKDQVVFTPRSLCGPEEGASQLSPSGSITKCFAHPLPAELGSLAPSSILATKEAAPMGLALEIHQVCAASGLQRLSGFQLLEGKRGS